MLEGQTSGKTIRPINTCSERASHVALPWQYQPDFDVYLWQCCGSVVAVLWQCQVAAWHGRGRAQVLTWQCASVDVAVHRC